MMIIIIVMIIDMLIIITTKQTESWVFSACDTHTHTKYVEISSRPERQAVHAAVMFIVTA